MEQLKCSIALSLPPKSARLDYYKKSFFQLLQILAPVDNAFRPIADALDTGRALGGVSRLVEALTEVDCLRFVIWI